uniref:Uncharacterized protein n=1 Tax=Anguilla anguilla TaxID=7936 RepID=A0A0E9P7Z6_ANGAN
MMQLIVITPHSSGGKTDCLAVGGLPVQTPPWACRSVLEQDT